MEGESNTEILMLKNVIIIIVIIAILTKLPDDKGSDNNPHEVQDPD